MNSVNLRTLNLETPNIIYLIISTKQHNLNPMVRIALTKKVRINLNLSRQLKAKFIKTW